MHEELDDMTDDDDMTEAHKAMFRHNMDQHIQWKDDVDSIMDDLTKNMRDMRGARHYLIHRMFAWLFVNGVWTRPHHNEDGYYLEVRWKLPQFVIKFEGMQSADEGGFWDPERRVWLQERYSERYPDRRK